MVRAQAHRLAQPFERHLLVQVLVQEALGAPDPAHPVGLGFAVGGSGGRHGTPPTPRPRAWRRSGHSGGWAAGTGTKAGNRCGSKTRRRRSFRRPRRRGRARRSSGRLRWGWRRESCTDGSTRLGAGPLDSCGQTGSAGPGSGPPILGENWVRPTARGRQGTSPGLASLPTSPRHSPTPTDCVYEHSRAVRCHRHRRRPGRHPARRRAGEERAADGPDRARARGRHLHQRGVYAHQDDGGQRPGRLPRPARPPTTA